MGIPISSPPEDIGNISRDSQLALVLQQLEDDKVQTLEKKEQMIMRDSKFVIMMQQQEENEAHKLMERKQRAM